MAAAPKEQQSLRYQLAVVTADKRLQREIKRVTAATNARALFATSVDAIEDAGASDLTVFDAREQAPAAKQLAQLPSNATISYIVDGDSLFQRVELLADTRVESILAREDRLDDSEFIVSATKSLGHDLFGLHKYFPWGVTVFSMEVKNYQEKTDAIDLIMASAETSGMRGPVRDRIQLVSDELLMNALYHAPTDDEGKERYRNVARKELTKLEEVSAVKVQYGCSGRYFGVSVRDEFGSLTRAKIVDYLTRIAQGVGAQIESKMTGAGLGIVSVAQSVSKLVFNIVPGVSTEVIALFEIDLIAQGKVGARSVHLFFDELGKGRPDEPAGAPSSTAALAPPAPPGLSLPWMVVSALASLLIALIIAYSLTRDAVGPSIAVIVEPPGAVIELDGQTLSNAEPLVLPPGESYHMKVQTKGYLPWERTFHADELDGQTRLYIRLTPAR